jgi:signal peptidase I
MSIFKFSTTIFTEQFLPSAKRTVEHIAWVKALLSGVQYARDKMFGFYKDGFTGESILAYDASSTYSIGDLVLYNKIVYDCILLSIGNLPTNATYFSVKTFVLGDTIKYVDRSVYYCIVENTNGVPPVNFTYWEKLQDNFIGLDERIATTAQVIVLENILNKWFGTSFNYPTAVNDVFLSSNIVDTDSFFYGVDEDESSSVYLTDSIQLDAINLGYADVEFNYDVNIPLAVYDGLSPDEATGYTTTKTAIASSFVSKYNQAGITFQIVTY